MSKKIWHVEVEGKQHIVEMQIDNFLAFGGGGRLVVDGKVVSHWGYSFAGMPKSKCFEIESKKGEVRRKGLGTMTLYFEGKRIQSS